MVQQCEGVQASRADRESVGAHIANGPKTPMQIALNAQAQGLRSTSRVDGWLRLHGVSVKPRHKRLVEPPIHLYGGEAVLGCFTLMQGNAWLTVLLWA